MTLRRFILFGIGLVQYAVARLFHSRAADPAVPILITSPQHLAFVFAGSARSFVAPFVHKTIQYNLIQSLCPTENMCKYDVFVRVSSNDNNHVGANAKGTLSVAPPDMKGKIASILKVLEPPRNIGKLYTDFFEIGTPEEIRTMIDYTKRFPDSAMRHKVYRDLDLRRYSMYFHRYKAYEMALKQEKVMGSNYTWVIFARLDTSWGAPVDSIHTLIPNIIYTPDTWRTEVPDTFAILPRTASDVYFSLEALLQPGAFCLGGPNLNTSTLHPSYLKTIGYNQTEIELVHQENCFTVFPTDYTSTTDGILWSESGVSERVLARKLQKHGYVLQLGTIRVLALYLVIMRFPLEPSCNYIHPGYLIYWAKVSNAPNSGFLPSCHLSNYDLKRYEKWTGHARNCKHNSTDPYNWHSREHNVDVAYRDSCLLHPEVSDLNFMPFRLRFRSLCLTTSKSHQIVNMTTCVNYRRQNDFMEKYDTDQLYHFYPLIPNPQKLFQYTIYPENRLCMTVQVPKYFHGGTYDPVESSMERLVFPVSMRRCHETSDLEEISTQMFTFHIIPNPRIDNSNVNIGRKTFLKPLSQLQIRWNWKFPTSSKVFTYCMSYPSHNRTDSTLHFVSCKESHLKTDLTGKEPVDGTLAEHTLQSIVLERAQTISPPLRPGITIGQWPAWPIE